MKRAVRWLLCLALVAGAAAAPQQGIPTREKPADYPVSQQNPQLSLGAMQLSRQQVRNSFSADLERGYIVVEVGVFPASAGGIELRREDFALRAAGSKTMARPASPETIASVLQKKNQRGSGRDVDIYPTAGVGYETGGRDPYGNRYPGGWTSSAGVGVGIGGNGPRAASSDADRSTMKTELQDKILPEGSLAKPAAGYLYFPVTGEKQGAYELEYRAGDAKLVLALPRPK
jgi:hypothetical protein